MLSIHGESHGGYCDGISRRDFLRIGALGIGGAGGLGGLSMAEILRAEAQLGIHNSKKSIIMIFLPGGPSHQDMYDIKTEAPSGIRGEFKPIQTSVPGIEICEHLPGIARRMDKLVPIRSIVGAKNRHAAFQCLTGRLYDDQPPGGWPALGPIISKLQGPTEVGMPPAVSLAAPTSFIRWGDPGQPGFLGPAYATFQPNQGGKEDMVLRDISLARLQERRRLLSSFDHFRRQADATGVMSGMDVFSEQAFGVLTSSKLVEALDLEREDPRTRERYGFGSPEPVVDAAPMYNEQVLMARRLIEAGVRFVTLAYGRWDTHAGENFDVVSNFVSLRKFLPRLDQIVTALIDDLDQRSMLDDVTVIVWGEFGRTPRINKRGGRDHWPNVSCALMAGGGMRTGQVIGSTDRMGAEAQDRPVHFQEVFATLYRNLGIDVRHATIPDLTGRPHYLVDGYEPLPELV